jgi:hypothetical protein
VIIWGWLSRPILLGAKADLCPICQQVTTHGIYRLTSWGHIFWFPFLPYRIRHVLLCSGCGREQKLGWRQVRAGIRSRNLPLGARPGFREWAMEVFNETNRMPNERELDAVEVNPKRGPWDLWLKAWPMLVVVLIVAVAASSALRPPVSAAPVVAPTGHACWQDRNGEILGCQMQDGTVVGSDDGAVITCYFVEPMPTGGLYCD